MRKKFLLLTTALVFISLLNISAQSKEEKALAKEWSKKMKAMDPLEYKKLVEDKESLVTQMSECENSKTNLRTEIESKDAEISKLKQELEAAAPVAVEAGSGSEGTDELGRTKGPTKGVVYKIQIGAFKNKDLSKYFDNNKNFSGDVDPDGAKKYTLGSFTEYWEADNFKKYLREMGVKDAWIVPYKDGKRVAMKDVLEGAL